MHTKVWVELKRDPTMDDKYVLDKLNVVFRYLLDFHPKQVLYNHPVWGEIIQYIYEIQHPQKTSDILLMNSLLNDAFYDFYLKNDETYNQLIENVNLDFKSHANNELSNWAIIKVQTNTTSLFRKVFMNYNRIYPKLFVGVFFEEVYDGFLIFFKEELDCDIVFREPSDLRSGYEFLKNYGFNVENYFNNNPLSRIIQTFQAKKMFNEK